MYRKTYLYLVIVFISSPVFPGQVERAGYKVEANALCDAFNPDTWKVDLKSMNPSQLAKMLSEKIKSAIHSDKMKKIYLSLSHDRSKFAYTNYVKSVSSLVGEPYSCDAMKDYFSLSTK